VICWREGQSSIHSDWFWRKHIVATRRIWLRSHEVQMLWQSLGFAFDVWDFLCFNGIDLLGCGFGAAFPFNVEAELVVPNWPYGPWEDIKVSAPKVSFGDRSLPNNSSGWISHCSNWCIVSYFILAESPHCIFHGICFLSTLCCPFGSYMAI